MTSDARPAVLAAGAVVWRRRGHGPIEVCLVHRPKYDDWSLPKGKAYAEEHVLSCAVREVVEETGHRVTLGRPLPAQHYDVAGRAKRVRYWLAEADPHASPREPDREVDDVVFLPVAEAVERLTHRQDRDLVSAAMSGPLRTTALVLLRHTNALERTAWHGPDGQRPLDASGSAAAKALAEPLSTLGLRRVVSSDAERCVETVRPFAERQHLPIELDPWLSEDGAPAVDRSRPADVITRAQRSGDATLVCSHRPVLPLLFESVGVEPVPSLTPGSFVVVHLHNGLVVATDRHDM